MTVKISKPAINVREELASLRNQGGYEEQKFYFDGLVTNGTFDSDTYWTKGTGWTISGGVATAVGGTSDARTLEQDIGLVKDKVYYYLFDVGGTVTSSNNLFLRFGANVNSLNITSSGTKSGVLTAAGSGNLIFRSDAETDDITIDNISVYETDGTDVIHTMPKGWKPKDVYEDGLLQREGSAHDYEVVYDGFGYKIKPTVAPSATTRTCVIGVKA